MCNLVRDCISVVKDIVQLISNSPKRNASFDAIRKETSPSTPNLRPLCPTRWTVRTAAFESVLLNYAVLIDTFEEISTLTRDEHGAKAAGLASRLQEFKTLFGFQLCLKVFSVTEQLSCLLQSKQTSIDTAINQANVLKSHLTRLRSDSEFDLFYKDVEQCATDVTDKPELPRQRRASKRVDPDNSQHQFSTPKDIHRKTYFELLDVMIQEIDRRLSKKALEIPHLIESVLLKSFAEEALPCDAIDKLSQFYSNDLTQEKLAREVTFIPDILHCVRKSEKYKGLKQISRFRQYVT